LTDEAFNITLDDRDRGGRAARCPRGSVRAAAGAAADHDKFTAPVVEFPAAELNERCAADDTRSAKPGAGNPTDHRTSAAVRHSGRRRSGEAGVE
jgi:hypothetical protein